MPALHCCLSARRYKGTVCHCFEDIFDCNLLRYWCGHANRSNTKLYESLEYEIIWNF